MNKYHKWYPIAQQWLEGATIQFKGMSGQWHDIELPCWDNECEYRVKPHKHQELIDAYNKGAKIEFYDVDEWLPASSPTWDENVEYRIKPKPDIIKRRWIAWVQENDLVPTWEYEPPAKQLCGSPVTQVDFIFDGETGKFKGVAIPPQP